MEKLVLANAYEANREDRETRLKHIYLNKESFVVFIAFRRASLSNFGMGCHVKKRHF